MTPSTAHLWLRVSDCWQRCSAGCRFALVVALLLLTASIGHAKDYALIVAGGSSQRNNNVSFERHVLLAQKVLAQRGFAHIDVLFADGDADEADLRDAVLEDGPAKPVQSAVLFKYYHQFYGPDFGLYSQLRNHRVPDVLGAATPENVNAWFRDQGSQLQAGDSLLLYFATHGRLKKEISTEKPQPKDSELSLWNGTRMSVADLTALVEDLPAGVQTELLITACYAGGFAELGWPAPVVAKLPVAGFFATSFDRPAAGCTSGSESASVRDYATCFWSALAGEWPNGKPLHVSPDLNGDKRVSFDEAHAFALVEDTTLDMPLKTSDFALRKISRFGLVDEPRLLGSDPAYNELRAIATAADRLLLDRLCLRMKLVEQRRLSKARTELRRLTFDLGVLAEARKRLSDVEPKLRAEFFTALGKTVEGPGEPSAEQLQKPISPDFVAFEKRLVELPAWHKLLECQARLAELDAERLLLEENWAVYQRFVQTAESVILAHNLPLVVEDAAILRRFEALRKAENEP